MSFDLTPKGTSVRAFHQEWLYFRKLVVKWNHLLGIKFWNRRSTPIAALLTFKSQMMRSWMQNDADETVFFFPSLMPRLGGSKNPFRNHNHGEITVVSPIGSTTFHLFSSFLLNAMIVGEFGYLTFGENFNISKLGLTESPSAGTAPLSEDSSSAGYLRCSVTWDWVGWNLWNRSEVCLSTCLLHFRMPRVALYYCIMKVQKEQANSKR